MNKDRLAISHDQLIQSYPVELVAQIASGCAGDTPRTRIEAALDLLEEAEHIAHACDPSIGPWLDQHNRTDEREGMPPDLRKAADEVSEARWAELEGAVPSIIEQATRVNKRTRKREIQRVALCIAACKHAERGAGQDHAQELFREWVAIAVEEHARRSAWHKQQHRQAGRKVATAAVIQRWNSEWGKKRKGLSASKKQEEKEQFLDRFETGSRTKVVRNEDDAREMLLGTATFPGFLRWLARKPARPQRKSRSASKRSK